MIRFLGLRRSDRSIKVDKIGVTNNLNTWQRRKKAPWALKLLPSLETLLFHRRPELTQTL